MIKIPITNEIVSCLISSGLTQETVKIMKADPKQFLQTVLKATLSEELTVKAVENTKDTIHLGLPYYAQVEKLNRLRKRSVIFRFFFRLWCIYAYARARMKR